MKHLKIIAYVLLLTLALGLVCGCGQDTGGSESSSSNAPVGSLNGRTITIAHWDPHYNLDEASATYSDDLAFITALENKYNCKIEFFNTGDWGVYETNATIIALSGGMVGDIMGHQFDRVVPLWARSGLLSPLEDFMDVHHPNFNSEYNDRYVYDGHYYGVTAQPECLGQAMLFNKRLCAEAGITDTELYQLLKDGKWTWEKFRELAIKCTRVTSRGQVWGFGSFGPVAANAGWWMYTNGTTPVLMDPKTFKLTYNYEDPKCIAAADFCRKLIFDDKVCYDGSREDGTWERLWLEGKVAFYQCPSWIMLNNGYADSEILSEDEIGILLMPKGPEAEDNVNIMAAIDGFFIPQQAEDKGVLGQLLTEFVPYKRDADWEYATIFKNWVFDEESLDVIRSIKGRTVQAVGEQATLYTTTVTFGDYGIYEGLSSRAFAAKWKSFSQTQFDDLAKQILTVEEPEE